MFVKWDMGCTDGDCLREWEIAKKPLAYVSGPYRSDAGRIGIDRNILQAEELAIELWRMGFAVICPHKNTAHLDGCCGNPEPWIDGDLVMVERCDLIVMLPRWRESEGAKIELDHAVKNDVPVYYWPEHRLRLEAIARHDDGFFDAQRRLAVASVDLHRSADASYRLRDPQ